MSDEVFRVGEVRIWVDGGIMLHAVTSYGDPVELSPSQSRLIGEHLIALAEADGE
jgi:hypothetical protein